MQLPLTGGCHCGKIRYQITEQPSLVYACHCTDCQHITSSAFSLGVALPEAAFRLTSGEPRALQRVPDSGRLNTRFICPDCACWVYSQPRGGVVRVRAGSLDDTSWFRPTRHIWTRSKQPWVVKGVCFCGAGATYGNASTRMSVIVPSDGTYAYGGWPDVDELYKKQLTENDPEKRATMLHEIQKILHERTRFAPIWDYFWPSGIGPRVEDAALMKIDPYPWSAPLEDVKLKTP